MRTPETSTASGTLLKGARSSGKLPGWAMYGTVFGAALAAAAVLAALSIFAIGLFVVATVIVACVATYAWSRTVEGSRRAKDRLMTMSIASAFGLAMIPLASLLVTVVSKGINRFDVAFFTESARGVIGEGGGASHAIVGTLVITAVATVIAVPIGLMAAIYLNEYGGDSRLRRALTFFVDVMTGIPSIVAGLFAYALFAIFLGPGIRLGIMGSVALSVLMVPIVIRSSEEVLKIVPNHLREASYALGTPKWKTTAPDRRHNPERNELVPRPRPRRRDRRCRSLHPALRATCGQCRRHRDRSFSARDRSAGRELLRDLRLQPPAVSAAGPNGPSGAAHRRQRLALAAALITVVFWGSTFVGIRAAQRDLSSGSLSLLRLLVGSVALGALVLLRRAPMPARRDVIGLLTCGVLWFGVYNLALNQAERTVDAGTAAMVVNIGPVFIAILSGLFLGEGFPRRLLLGCAIAFAGTATIGIATSTHGFQAGIGALLCIVAAAAYASREFTAEKPLLSRNSALTVTWAACGIGAVVCMPFAPQLAQELPHAHWDSVVWAIYLGVVPTALGFSFWAFALARCQPGRMGATTYLVPPVAVALGWAILGEVPAILAIVGGCICITGVAVTRG